jgi:hypothetical protein
MKNNNLLDFIHSGSAARPLLIHPALNEKDSGFWKDANKAILWGWKRDAPDQSRTVYFSGKLAQRPDGITVKDSFLYYRHQTSREAASTITANLENALVSLRDLVNSAELQVRNVGANSAIIQFKVGLPTDEDADRVSRLLKRRPRKVIRKAEYPPERLVEETLDLFPVDARRVV